MIFKIPNFTPHPRHTYTHPVTSGKRLFVRMAEFLPEVGNLDQKKENHSYQKKKFLRPFKIIAFSTDSAGKDFVCNAGDTGNAGSIPGSRRSPRGGMSTHTSVLAGKTPWTGEPGGLQSNGSQSVGHDWATKPSTSNMQKVNKILFPYWCYLKFTHGDDTCLITHVCQAILERDSPSHEGEGKPGSSDLALKEFILPRRWHKLEGATTEAEEKRHDQTLWRKGIFTMHLWVPGRESFLGKLVVDCSSYTWAPGDGWAWPRWPEHPSFRVSSEGGREQGSETRPEAYAMVPTPPPTACARELLSRVGLFATPWTAARQASLSFTIFQSLLKLMSIELVMPSNHLIRCSFLLLPPSIFPSIRVFSNESALRIRWPKYWSFSFSISPSNEHSGLISFRMNLGVNGH